MKPCFTTEELKMSTEDKFAAIENEIEDDYIEEPEFIYAKVGKVNRKKSRDNFEKKGVRKFRKGEHSQ